MYKLTSTDVILRLEDGAFIPADQANSDYLDYLAWVDEGNEPLPAMTLDERRAAAAQRIKSERDRRAQRGGYKVIIEGSPKWFHSDAQSRIQQIGLVMYGTSMPSGIEWKTMDGTFVTMTPALAQQVFDAAGQSDAATYAHAETLILEVTTSDEPEAVNILSGWPSIFAEA